MSQHILFFIVENEAPVANAGGNQEIQLPQLLVTLDGSKSTDDHKITDYHWVRDPKSLAAGVSGLTPYWTRERSGSAVECLT